MAKASVTFKYGLVAAMTLLLAFSFAPTPVLAGTCTCVNGDVSDVSSQAACTATCGAPTGGVKNFVDTGTAPTTTPTSGTNVTLENPLSFCGKGTSALSGQQCVQLIIGNVIKAALGVVGSIALIIIMWGGFRWLTAMGNSEKVEKGKEILIWAVIGLIVIFGAYAVTSYVITALTGAK